MALIIEGGRVPTRWLERRGGYKPRSANHTAGHHGSLRLAFVNNMPDAALEDTELQFFGLVDAASGDVPVRVRLYSLAGVPRAQRGIERLGSYYFDFDDLWRHKFDAAIITGTEPHQPNLRHEPYWKRLADLFDWATRETTSTVLSCLAAHAGVLHNDGVGRHRLPDKQFGVFESQKVINDSLIAGVPSRLHFPHSRWNEVRERDLISAGYAVLTKSKDAGVDLFTKKVGRSLFVHFQGHPEYSRETLFKEYRRDVKRFLRGERETYPSMPYGYFARTATAALADFRESALCSKSEGVMASFPESLSAELEDTWSLSALSLYREWLQYVWSARTTSGLFPRMASSYGDGQPKRAPAI